MTNDDLIFRHRVRLFARAGEVGVAGACRELGYHRSWYYRWKPMVERHGLEILMPREGRPRLATTCLCSFVYLWLERDCRVAGHRGRDWGSVARDFGRLSNRVGAILDDRWLLCELVLDPAFEHQPHGAPSGRPGIGHYLKQLGGHQPRRSARMP